MPASRGSKQLAYNIITKAAPTPIKIWEEGQKTGKSLERSLILGILVLESALREIAKLRLASHPGMQRSNIRHGTPEAKNIAGLGYSNPSILKIYLILQTPNFTLMHDHRHVGDLNRHIVSHRLSAFLAVLSHTSLCLQVLVPQPERISIPKGLRFVSCHHLFVGYVVSQS